LDLQEAMQSAALAAIKRYDFFIVDFLWSYLKGI
jgi:hypothetical protein